MIQHELTVNGRKITLREPTWGDQKAWDASNTTLVAERGVTLVKSVDGVPGADGLSVRDTIILGTFADKLCVFGEEEGAAVLQTLHESMDGIFRTWTFTARDRTYKVREPTPAVYILAMKQHGTGKPGYNALAERCLVEVDGKPPPPGSAASIGIPLPVMNYIGALVYGACFVSEDEADTAHKGAALVETP